MSNELAQGSAWLDAGVDVGHVETVLARNFLVAGGASIP